MAETRNLSVLSDAVLIKKFKEFSGVDRDLVLRVLRKRFDSGLLKTDLPHALRHVFKKTRRS